MADAASSVFAVLRTDYLARDDDEGRLNLISIHGTLDGANKAAKDHVKRHSEGSGLQDPNTKSSNHADGTVNIQVIVGDDDYHSFQVLVSKEALHDGEVIPAQSSPEDSKPAKTTAATAKTAKGTANGAPAASAEPTKATKGKAAKAKEPKSEAEAENETKPAAKASSKRSADPPAETTERRTSKRGKKA